MLEQFIEDVENLDRAYESCPITKVVVRVWRRWSGGAFWASAGPLQYSDLYVGLYRLESGPRDRPFLSFSTDPMQDIESEMRLAVVGTAHGWPAFGRGLVVEVADRVLWPTGPATTHAFSPRRGPLANGPTTTER